MENKKLIKLSNGNIKEMTCSEVLEQFKNFLYKTSHKWSKQYDVEDIFQIAGIGLTKAYNTYDVDKGINFITYLSMIVSNEIRMYHRKNKKHSGVKSLDGSLSVDKDGNSMSLIDVISDDIDYAEIAVENINRIWTKSVLVNLIQYLNSREKMIIEDKFINGLTQRQIQDKLKLSQSYISRLIKNSLEKMKKYYESEEFNVNVNTRKECFKYFSANDIKDKVELINDVVKNYGCTHGTAENYYYTWKSQYLGNKNVSKLKMKETNSIDIKDTSIVKKSKYEKVKEFKPRNGILQATDLRGKIMCYSLYENGNGFNMKRPNGNTVMPIDFIELDDLIKELQAVKKAGE